MVLYKQVNGKRIQLSEEEEAELLAKWEKENASRNEQERKIDQFRKKRKAFRDLAKSKLKSMGLTYEEIQSLIEESEDLKPKDYELIEKEILLTEEEIAALEKQKQKEEANFLKLKKEQEEAEILRQKQKEEAKILAMESNVKNKILDKILDDVGELFVELGFSSKQNVIEKIKKISEKNEN